MRSKEVFIVVLFFVKSIVSFSQLILPKNLDTFDWGVFEEIKSDSIKNNLINKIVESNMFDNYNDYPEGRNINNYHLIDFNGDSYLDIIYDGKNPPGIEVNNVAFFLNKGDSLECVGYFLGDFMSITKISKTTPISFELNRHPCCAQFLFYLSEYKINSVPYSIDSTQLKYEGYYKEYGKYVDFISLTKQVRYAYHTEFPKSLDVIDTIFLTKKVFLTPQPFPPVDTNFNADRTAFHFLKNKAIAELTIGQKCVVLSKKRLTNGDTYYFIMLKITSITNNYCSEEPDAYQYGWIKIE